MGLPRRDDLIKLCDVPKIILKKTGIKRSRVTVYNWCRNGIRAYDHRLVRLKTERRLKQIFTTEEWIMKFLEDISWRE